MTIRRIAISLSTQQLARVLAEHEKRLPPRALLSDLTKQHGAPGAEEIKWAKGALGQARLIAI